MPAFFNNTIYYGAVGDSIRAFGISNAQLASTAASQTANAFPYPGVTPSISANGTHDAILWAVENSNPAVLHAYDAGNLATELFTVTRHRMGETSLAPGTDSSLRRLSMERFTSERRPG